MTRLPGCGGRGSWRIEFQARLGSRLEAFRLFGSRARAPPGPGHRGRGDSAITDENKKAAIAEELARAGEALRACELLAQHGLLSDAVSRLMKYREEADYNPAHPFRPEDLALMLSEARDLAGRILAALRQRGLI